MKKLFQLRIKSNNKYYDKRFLINFNKECSKEAYLIVNSSESPSCK